MLLAIRRERQFEPDNPYSSPSSARFGAALESRAGFFNRMNKLQALLKNMRLFS